MVQAGDVAPEVGTVVPVPGSVLVFYKVSCPTCKLTMPYLHRVTRPVVGVSQNNAEETARFEQSFDVRVRSVLDPEDTFEASNRYGVRYVPTLFVIGADGRVEERVEGFEKDVLERLGVEFTAAEKVPEYKPG